MNPEEGELRPQLLDRFGLCVNITGIKDTESRVRIMERRAEFDTDPAGFISRCEEESQELTEKIIKAKQLFRQVGVEKKILYTIAEYCLETGVDGHRGDIITLKAAKTIAAFAGRSEVTIEDVERAAELTLPHRVRRQPFQDISDSVVREKKDKKETSEKPAW